jgi:YesN/AraC family two-component response regulator
MEDNMAIKKAVHESVLLVDDDPVFRSEFQECFGEYGVVQAGNGEEALSILKKPNAIDLVFLDVRMSGLSGIDVLSRIRKLNPNLRVVILTGYSSKDIAIEALRGQADDYIEKPLDIEATKQIMEKFIGRRRGAPGLDSIDAVQKIERVKEFVRRNIFKKITLEDAASAVCLSPKYLSRIFKDHAGVGFNDYKLALKMDEARNLLLTTGYTVEQITDKLGYQTAESFIRQFKKHTSQTPGCFRKKAKGKKHK